MTPFLQRCSPPADDPRAVTRPSGRAVVVDPAGAVLVVWTETFGFTPGGGLEGDEDPASAARRELAEETGYDDVEIGPVVLRRIARLDFLGDWIEAHETFYLVRVEERFDADPQHLERYEADSFESLDWMTPAELRADRRRLYPWCLPDLVEAINAGAYSDPESDPGPWEEVDLYDDPARVVIDVPGRR